MSSCTCAVHPLWWYRVRHCPNINGLKVRKQKVSHSQTGQRRPVSSFLSLWWTPGSCSKAPPPGGNTSLPCLKGKCFSVGGEKHTCHSRFSACEVAYLSPSPCSLHLSPHNAERTGQTCPSAAGWSLHSGLWRTSWNKTGTVCVLTLQEIKHEYWIRVQQETGTAEFLPV